MQPQLGRRSPHVGRFPPDQRADTSTATKTAATLPGAAGSRGATVNQPPKSVVREICTPRSVGTGGGRPPPVTRWRGVILVPTATHVSDRQIARAIMGRGDD